MTQEEFKPCSDCRTLLACSFEMKCLGMIQRPVASVVSTETQRQLAALGKANVAPAGRPDPRPCRVILVGCWSKSGKVVRVEDHRVDGKPVQVDILAMDDGTMDQRALTEARELPGGMLVWRI
jgi:hypothetical protein